MPRQFGRLDESVGWPALPCCPHRHRASTPCPPTGVWLVLVLCRRCDPRTGRYCRDHRDWVAEETAAAAGPKHDVQMVRIGEEGAA